MPPPEGLEADAEDDLVDESADEEGRKHCHSLVDASVVHLRSIIGVGTQGGRERRMRATVTMRGDDVMQVCCWRIHRRSVVADHEDARTTTRTARSPSLGKCAADTTRARGRSIFARTRLQPGVRAWEKEDAYFSTALHDGIAYEMKQRFLHPEVSIADSCTALFYHERESAITGACIQHIVPGTTYAPSRVAFHQSLVNSRSAKRSNSAVEAKAAAAGMNINERVRYGDGAGSKQCKQSIQMRLGPQLGAGYSAPPPEPTSDQMILTDLP